MLENKWQDYKLFKKANKTKEYIQYVGPKDEVDEFKNEEDVGGLKIQKQCDSSKWTRYCFNIAAHLITYDKKNKTNILEFTRVCYRETYRGRIYRT